MPKPDTTADVPRSTRFAPRWNLVSGTSVLQRRSAFARSAPWINYSLQSHQNGGNLAPIKMAYFSRDDRKPMWRLFPSAVNSSVLLVSDAASMPSASREADEAINSCERLERHAESTKTPTQTRFICGLTRFGVSGGQLEGGIVTNHDFALGLLTRPAFECISNSEVTGCEANIIT